MGLIVTLILMGALLVFAEIFLPGMVAGLLGGLCLLSAVFVGYAQFHSPFNHLLALGILTSLGVGFVVWVLFFPDSSLGQRFASKKIIGGLGNERVALLGCEGHAVTDLRPSGIALIGGHRVDVLSEGGYLVKGTLIKVIATEGMRVVVRGVDEVESAVQPHFEESEGAGQG